MRSIKRAIRSYCGIVIIFGVLSGCDSIPPDILIQPVTPEKIHGQVGYLIDIGIHRGSAGQPPETTAFRIANWGNSSPIFVRVIHSNVSDDLKKILSHLGNATILGVSVDKPDNTPHLGGVFLGSSDTVVSWYVYVVDGAPASCKIIIKTNDYTDAFHTMISKPADTILLQEDEEPDTPEDGPSQEFTNWLNSNPIGQAPPVITEGRYVNDGTTGTATDPDINSVRKKQEEFLQSAYGSDYQDDQHLHRAIRVVDRISERFRGTWLRFLTHRNFDTLLAERDAILQQETGLAYYTTDWTWQNIVLGIYLEEVGNLPPTEYGTDIEYLRLHFTHPNEGKGQLLNRFRESVKNGRILEDNPWYDR